MKALSWKTVTGMVVFASAMLDGTAARAAANDACSLLTTADVGAALGTPAKTGQPITPTDHKVCTWKAANGRSWVTLMVQPSSAFDGGLRLASYSNGSLKPERVAGLGEGAYFLPVGDQVGLMVKKGGVAFKVAVYQHGPIGPKEAAERTLAGKVVGRL
jgi:hypothetical protein